jgi:hypothetical protein
MTSRGAASAILVLLLVPVGVLGLAPQASRAAGQSAPVGLTLLAQTPWTTVDHPELRIAVVATNVGQARLGDLSLDIALGPAFDSRIQYDTALTTGSPTETFRTSFPFRGTLDPGRARTFTVTVDLSSVTAVSPTDSRVYPGRVELVSGGDPAASLFTPFIHIVRTPESAVRMSMSLELLAPAAMRPDDVLIDQTFDAAIAPGGVLSAPVEALRRMELGRGPSAPFDLALQPSLLTQVRAMGDGYALPDGTEVAEMDPGAEVARSFARSLVDVTGAPEVQTVALPFSGPSIPSLLASGLESDLLRQQNAGARLVRSGTETTPSTDVARPPAGVMDEATLDWLAKRGVTTVLADANSVQRSPQPNEFAPPPTATIATQSGADVTLVLPDPGTQALFERADLLADPVRAAQAVLGELAIVWREQPVPGPQPDGSETVRGLALSLPARLPPGVWTPLLERVASAPFLEPVHADDLVAAVNPPGPRQRLRASDPLTFSVPYASSLRLLQSDVDAYASMLVDPGNVAETLRRDLFTAESRVFLGNEAASRPWLDAVTAVTDPAFAGATPQVDQLFTFTSGEGTIPLRMGDPGPAPIRVIVELRSSQFTFPDGASQEVTLDRPNQIVSFLVVAKAAGQNPIQVAVLAPSGSTLSTQTIAVRTTAVNRIALLVTVAAAGGLLLLFVRRWQRRKISN